MVRRGIDSIGRRGFTLVEIIIVLVIIGISVAIAIPVYTNYINGLGNSLAIRNIRLLEQAIKTYELENLRLPDFLDNVGPVSFLNAKGETITQSPPFLDPWNRSFQYLNLANDNPPAYPNARRDGADKPLSLDYDLYSMGVDGLTQKRLDNPRSLDDIVRARSGAFVNLASKY